jgi:hypothetical protein
VKIEARLDAFNATLDAFKITVTPCGGAEQFPHEYSGGYGFGFQVPDIGFDVRNIGLNAFEMF